MSMDIPSIDTLKHVADRLRANDISWFKDRFKAGDFAWLKDRLPEGGYTKLGERIEAGDLGYVRTLFGGLDLPGFGGIFGSAGKAAAAVGTAAAGVGAAKAVAGAKAGAAGSAAKNVVINDDSNRKKGAVWLLPVALLAAIGIGFGISRLAKDDKKVAVDTGAVESVAAETVASETVAAESVAAESVAAETVPAETVAASVVETSAVAETTVPAAANIIDTATKAGSFNTLLAAVNAAGLTEVLNGPGPFTVFAPSDDAFAKLPPGLVDALVKPENKDTLAKILTYHVVSGTVMAADIKPGDVATVQGGTIKLATDGGVTINGSAKVTSADIVTSNGVIHVIDTVLSSAELEQIKVIGFPPGAADSVPAETTVADSAPADLTKENKAGDATPEDLTVYFDSGSDKVNAAGQVKVDGAVKVLSALPAGTKVALVGRADKTGDAAQNLRLSTRRANNVEKAILAGLGDKAANITFTKDAKGDEEKIDDLAAARRVTIEIAK
jgi:uncharacterized surface protein with fasciclin (FAS1) repeats/outer membrane protein OmpA-like peptidoglycan-associated protein